jgi:hypothetical protein
MLYVISCYRFFKSFKDKWGGMQFPLMVFDYFWAAKVSDSPISNGQQYQRSIDGFVIVYDQGAMM